MTEETFLLELPTGAIGGWTRAGSTDRKVLLLHGGPGLSDYMSWLADDLDDWTCASFQQRGLAPSPVEGPFDVTTAVDDVAAVLDHLAAQGWERPVVAGHSWGGYLAWHVAVRLADRVRGVLAIDPLGAVGDMGLPAFGQELRRRVTPDARVRLDELDELDEREGAGRDDDRAETLAILWPSYFAEPATAPPMPDVHFNQVANEQLMSSAFSAQPALVRALESVTTPLGAIVGGRSPMPNVAASDVTGLVPAAWTEVVPNAGHFLWHEAPGAASAALGRLLAD